MSHCGIDVPNRDSNRVDPRPHGQCVEPLAHRFGTWHAAAMQSSKRPPRAGGAAIALLALAGVVIGNHYGQASIGLLVGLGSGVAIAVGLWLLDQRG